MIPAPLGEARRWLVWRHLSGKKPPVGPSGQPLADWTDPDQWVDQATAEARREAAGGDGIGFVLGAGWAGVDLDDCRDPKTGAVDPRALAVVREMCAGAYHEVSPSGLGIKIFGRGQGWLELSFKDPARVAVGRKESGYFCVTGRDGEGGVDVALPLDLIAEFFGAPARDPNAPRREPLPEVVRPGMQNQELFREACRHARDGKSEAEIFAIVRAVGLERCPPAPGSPPWTDGDFWAIARSASRYRPADDPFPRTESGDAEFFARLHSDSVRYDHRRARWVRFDGTRWAPQAAGEVERLALESARARAAAAVRNAQKDESWKDGLKWAVGGESASRRAHLLSLAQMEPQIADDGEDWDRDPWLLGVPNGVLDLRDGSLREGRPGDRISMRARFPYRPDAQCPQWEAFVSEIFSDNPDLVPYVQRALGYSMTGDCREEVFFLLTGSGRNGKGTLINTASHVLGDYADDLAFHSLEKSREGDKSTNDLAKLVGRRLVTASESTGGRFNEARIKSMTGRDPITARFLYQEEFTFQPAFKLWLSVNHLPRVQDDSAGFWSRPHRVPFLQSYVGREDRGLKDRLRSEGEGILAWMTRGCLAWQRDGLPRPAAVEAALAEYRLSQEPLAGFYEDRCVFVEGASTNAGQLRDAYIGWCDERRIFGAMRLGPQRFSQELARRIGEPRRTRNGMAYQGIGLAAGAGTPEL